MMKKMSKIQEAVERSQLELATSQKHDAKLLVGELQQFEAAMLGRVSELVRAQLPAAAAAAAAAKETQAAATAAAAKPAQKKRGSVEPAEAAAPAATAPAAAAAAPAMPPKPPEAAATADDHARYSSVLPASYAPAAAIPVPPPAPASHFGMPFFAPAVAPAPSPPGSTAGGSGVDDDRWYPGKFIGRAAAGISEASKIGSMRMKEFNPISPAFFGATAPSDPAPPPAPASGLLGGGGFLDAFSPAPASATPAKPKSSVAV